MAQIASGAPMVYLWLSPKDAAGESFDPLYVGKAGLGVSQRLRQHRGGFSKSAPGQKNLENIKNLLGQGRRLLVYARKAGTQEILGAAINLYSAEEEAIHELYHPSWNRAQFAGGSRRMKTEAQKAEAASTSSDETLGICGDIDFTDVLRGEMMAEFYRGLDAANQDRLCRLLRWALCLQASTKADMKVVLKYTNQPSGYNGIPTFLLAEFGAKGKAKKDGWVLRIPLRCDDKYPLTVTLPSRTMGTQVQLHQISEGKHTNFRPLDLIDFLNRPDHYTTHT